MSRNMYIAIFLIVVLQGVSISVLLLRADKKSPVVPGRQENSLWQVQKRLGDQVLGKNDLAQAIYFYENALREIPHENSQRKNLQDKLTELYEKNQEKRQQIKDFPKELQTTPRCYRDAELAYQQGYYFKARKLFYEFLAQQDKSTRNRNLASKARLRLNQCRLFSAIESIDQMKTRDSLVSQALKLMQK